MAQRERRIAADKAMETWAETMKGPPSRRAAQDIVEPLQFAIVFALARKLEQGFVLAAEGEADGDIHYFEADLAQRGTLLLSVRMRPA